jgi:hypothetical protein
VLASFTASEAISNAVIRVVPAIESFVRVAPASFGSIAPGQKINLTITFFAPVTSPSGTLDGTIQLRSAVSPPRNFAQPLPVTLMIQGLPPDPGAAGKATLQGIDSDGDGVRDDIQRYIALTYSNSEKTRAALTQSAKALHFALLDTQDKNKSIAHMIERIAAYDCLYAIRPNDAAAISGELRAQMLNTEERIGTYLTYDEQLGGQFFERTPRAQRLSRCNFDSATMEN